MRTTPEPRTTNAVTHAEKVGSMIVNVSRPNPRGQKSDGPRGKNPRLGMRRLLSGRMADDEADGGGITNDGRGARRLPALVPFKTAKATIRLPTEVNLS